MSAALIVTGEYGRRGYTVFVCSGRGARSVYSAGNNPSDSQARPEGPGLGLRALRRFCMRTCKEIAAERRARYGGVVSVPEEETS